MAIKGKRKAQKRGSQARRRPATAPRAIAPPRRTPWHQTSGGRVAIAVGLTLIAVAIVGAIGIINSNANKEEQRQAFLNDYTNRVRSMSSFVAQPVSEMTAVTTVPKGEELADLGDSAGAWVDTLTEAEGRLAAIGPTVGPPGVFDLLSQAIGLYSAAAKTYRILPDANPEIRADLYGRAVDQKDRAEAIWTQAVATLDRARADAGLDVSGLGTPGTSTPTQPPAPVTPAPTGGGEGGGGGGQGEGDGDGGGGNG